MKFRKMFVPVLLVLTFFFSTLNFSAASEITPLKSSNTKEFLKTAFSNYLEYLEINGQIWVIVYDDDGKEIERYPHE